jgi:N-acetylneuraminic acid mutarotase
MIVDEQVQIYNPSTDNWSYGANIPWFVDGGMSSATINGQ